MTSRWSSGVAAGVELALARRPLLAVIESDRRAVVRVIGFEESFTARDGWDGWVVLTLIGKHTSLRITDETQ